MRDCRALKKTVVGLTLGVSALALFGMTERAERPLKVLMVGNSFSICVLNEMPAIAASFGRPLDLTSLYIGGCPLSRHVANLSATNHPYDVRWNSCGRKDLAVVPFAGKLVAKTWPQGHTDQLGNLRDILAGDRWDVVTIQQASHESWRWECFEPHADTLIAAIREEAPQAKIVIQQTWSYNKKDSRICDPKTGGPGSWKIDQDGMFACLSTNYLRLARRYGLDVIPTGCAVQCYRKSHPDLKAEDDVVGVAKTGDTIHLNARGHYLQGLVWVSALLGVNALDCTYAPKGMAAADAQALRRAAAEAFDELRRLQEKSCHRIKNGIYDLVVYGSTPAAFSAAVQARRMGKSVVIVSPETRIGGLTTGGLGQTDIGNKSAFGGIALEFYRDVAKWYADEAHWTRQKSSEYFPDGQCAGSRDGGSMWTFEPSAALQILWSWVKRDQLELRTGERLDRRAGKVKVDEVEVEGRGRERRIVSFVTEKGDVYRGRMFIDATYEGDLLAAAGVSYAVGREDNAVYGETANGCVPREARGAKNHNFAAPVSAYVVPGDKSSGLLPGIEPYDPTLRSGQGDRRVQAYCFRMCLTDDPENRIPFAKPASYDEREYELLFRDYEAVDAHPEIEQHGALTAKYRIPAIMSRMPNRKTDTNNRCAVSTDFIGRNWNWPEASYAERERILNAHWEYQKGLMWTLANHPRIPKEVREYFSQFGTCKDEFLDGLGEGWQRQLYVREARRMVGEYVMTEHNCRGKVAAPHPVGMGAYGMDSHNVRRIETKDGLVLNEGNIEDYLAHDGSRIQPYGIDYGALVPKRGECANLLVPVCLSASHIAFGSIRMEPVFFALGQAAATAAALAVEGGTGVQDVDYAALRRRLVADGQVLP